MRLPSKGEGFGSACYHDAPLAEFYTDFEKNFGGIVTARSLSELIGMEEFRAQLHDFSLATGLGAVYLSADGETLLRPECYRDQCAFCSLVWECEAGREHCRQHMLETGQLSFRLGEPYIARCHAGLISISVPIPFEGELLGSVSCGPVMMWDWDEMAVQEILQRTAALKTNMEALLVASRSIRVLTSQQVRANANLLYRLVTQISKDGVEALEQRRQITEQQMKLAQTVYERKWAQTDRKAGPRDYPIHREQDMLVRVKLGDRTGAREILNELLGDVFFRSAGSLEVMKAQILELVVVISRAAVEGGAALDHLLGMNYQYISQLSGIDTFEDMCHWVVSVLDSFMDAVYASRNVKNSMNLGEALRYIREHYHQSITLEDVASHVHISPFYLSHLFREELGITYVEHLTQVRMEKARQMLRGTLLPISQVAARCGYEDSSYFCKVFKRIMKVTPNQYRKIR